MGLGLHFKRIQLASVLPCRGRVGTMCQGGGGSRQPRTEGRVLEQDCGSGGGACGQALDVF